ncbi:hypothetical protein GN958_ATG22875 [Phytophthora infestans]|uniref:Uncharacterized protein n=1 Tax=Phytophthora infestans TaxID=4787 RepID=A0A8S9TMI1_PHYIN|nr:hypothetical protein GN958_ATG22875 [Phytophthora infestans]
MLMAGAPYVKYERSPYSSQIKPATENPPAPRISAKVKVRPLFPASEFWLATRSVGPCVAFSKSSFANLPPWSQVLQSINPPVMATYQQEVKTPVVDTLQSPAHNNAVDYDHYQYQTPDSTFKVDVSANSQDVFKEGNEKGKPLKKFLWWRITKKQRIFAIVGIVLVLLAVLIIIAWFVIVKAVFQHNVNKIKMSVNYLDINQISDQTTLSSELSLHLTHDLSMNARSDATTAKLLYEGSTFATFEFPALKIDKGEQSYDLKITSDLIVTDADVFSSMSTAVMDDVSVVFDTTAKVKAHALGFSYGGLDFKRELSIEGSAIL